MGNLKVPMSVSMKVFEKVYLTAHKTVLLWEKLELVMEYLKDIKMVQMMVQ